MNEQLPSRDDGATIPCPLCPAGVPPVRAAPAPRRPLSQEGVGGGPNNPPERSQRREP